MLQHELSCRVSKDFWKSLRGSTLSPPPVSPVLICSPFWWEIETWNWSNRSVESATTSWGLESVGIEHRPSEVFLQNENIGSPKWSCESKHKVEALKAIAVSVTYTIALLSPMIAREFIDASVQSSVDNIDTLLQCQELWLVAGFVNELERSVEFSGDKLFLLLPLHEIKSCA